MIQQVGVFMLLLMLMFGLGCQSTFGPDPVGSQSPVFHACPPGEAVYIDANGMSQPCVQWKD